MGALAQAPSTEHPVQDTYNQLASSPLIPDQCIPILDYPISAEDLEGLTGENFDPTDIDRDGESNDYEITHFSDPTNKESTSLDRDGDDVPAFQDPCDYDARVPTSEILLTIKRAGAAVTSAARGDLISFRAEIRVGSDSHLADADGDDVTVTLNMPDPRSATEIALDPDGAKYAMVKELPLSRVTTGVYEYDPLPAGAGGYPISLGDRTGQWSINASARIGGAFRETASFPLTVSGHDGPMVIGVQGGPEYFSNDVLRILAVPQSGKFYGAARLGFTNKVGTVLGSTSPVADVSVIFVDENADGEADVDMPRLQFLKAGVPANLGEGPDQVLGLGDGTTVPPVQGTDHVYLDATGAEVTLPSQAGLLAQIVFDTSEDGEYDPVFDAAFSLRKADGSLAGLGSGLVRKVTVDGDGMRSLAGAHVDVPKPGHGFFNYTTPDQPFDLLTGEQTPNEVDLPMEWNSTANAWEAILDLRPMFITEFNAGDWKIDTYMFDAAVRNNTADGSTEITVHEFPGELLTIYPLANFRKGDTILLEALLQIEGVGIEGATIEVDLERPDGSTETLETTDIGDGRYRVEGVPTSLTDAGTTFLFTARTVGFEPEDIVSAVLELILEPASVPVVVFTSQFQYDAGRPTNPQPPGIPDGSTVTDLMDSTCRPVPLTSTPTSAILPTVGVDWKPFKDCLNRGLEDEKQNTVDPVFSSGSVIRINAYPEPPEGIFFVNDSAENVVGGIDAPGVATFMIFHTADGQPITLFPQPMTWQPSLNTNYPGGLFVAEYPLGLQSQILQGGWEVRVTFIDDGENVGLGRTTLIVQDDAVDQNVPLPPKVEISTLNGASVLPERFLNVDVGQWTLTGTYRNSAGGLPVQHVWVRVEGSPRWHEATRNAGTWTVSFSTLGEPGLALTGRYNVEAVAALDPGCPSRCLYSQPEDVFQPGLRSGGETDLGPVNVTLGLSYETLLSPVFGILVRFTAPNLAPDLVLDGILRNNALLGGGAVLKNGVSNLVQGSVKLNGNDISEIRFIAQRVVWANCVDPDIIDQRLPITAAATSTQGVRTTATVRVDGELFTDNDDAFEWCAREVATNVDLVALDVDPNSMSDGVLLDDDGNYINWTFDWDVSVHHTAQAPDTLVRRVNAQFENPGPTPTSTAIPPVGDTGAYLGTRMSRPYTSATWQPIPESLENATDLAPWEINANAPPSGSLVSNFYRTDSRYWIRQEVVTDKDFQYRSTLPETAQDRFARRAVCPPGQPINLTEPRLGDDPLTLFTPGDTALSPSHRVITDGRCAKFPLPDSGNGRYSQSGVGFTGLEVRFPSGIPSGTIDSIRNQNAALPDLFTLDGMTKSAWADKGGALFRANHRLLPLRVNGTVTNNGNDIRAVGIAIYNVTFNDCVTRGNVDLEWCAQPRLVDFHNVPFSAFEGGFDPLAEHVGAQKFSVSVPVPAGGFRQQDTFWVTVSIITTDGDRHDYVPNLATWNPGIAAAPTLPTAIPNDPSGQMGKFHDDKFAPLVAFLEGFNFPAAGKNLNATNGLIDGFPGAANLIHEAPIQQVKTLRELAPLRPDDRDAAFFDTNRFIYAAGSPPQFNVGPPTILRPIHGTIFDGKLRINGTLNDFAFYNDLASLTLEFNLVRWGNAGQTPLADCPSRGALKCVARPTVTIPLSVPADPGAPGDVVYDVNRTLVNLGGSNFAREIEFDAIIDTSMIPETVGLDIWNAKKLYDSEFARVLVTGNLTSASGYRTELPFFFVGIDQNSAPTVTVAKIVQQMVDPDPLALFSLQTTDGNETTDTSQVARILFDSGPSSADRSFTTTHDAYMECQTAANALVACSSPLRTKVIFDPDGSAIEPGLHQTIPNTAASLPFRLLKADGSVTSLPGDLSAVSVLIVDGNLGSAVPGRDGTFSKTVDSFVECRTPLGAPAPCRDFIAGRTVADPDGTSGTLVAITKAATQFQTIQRTLETVQPILSIQKANHVETSAARHIARIVFDAGVGAPDRAFDTASDAYMECQKAGGVAVACSDPARTAVVFDADGSTGPRPAKTMANSGAALPFRFLKADGTSTTPADVANIAAVIVDGNAGSGTPGADGTFSKTVDSYLECRTAADVIGPCRSFATRRLVADADGSSGASAVVLTTFVQHPEFDLDSPTYKQGNEYNVRGNFRVFVTVKDPDGIDVDDFTPGGGKSRVMEYAVGKQSPPLEWTVVGKNSRWNLLHNQLGLGPLGFSDADDKGGIKWEATKVTGPIKVDCVDAALDCRKDRTNTAATPVTSPDSDPSAITVNTIEFFVPSLTIGFDPAFVRVGAQDPWDPTTWQIVNDPAGSIDTNHRETQVDYRHGGSYGGNIRGCGQMASKHVKDLTPSLPPAQQTAANNNNNFGMLCTDKGGSEGAIYQGVGPGSAVRPSSLLESKLGVLVDLNGQPNNGGAFTGISGTGTLNSAPRAIGVDDGCGPQQDTEVRVVECVRALFLPFGVSGSGSLEGNDDWGRCMKAVIDNYLTVVTGAPSVDPRGTTCDVDYFWVDAPANKLFGVDAAGVPAHKEPRGTSNPTGGIALGCLLTIPGCYAHETYEETIFLVNKNLPMFFFGPEESIDGIIPLNGQCPDFNHPCAGNAFATETSRSNGYTGPSEFTIPRGYFWKVAADGNTEAAEPVQEDPITGTFEFAKFDQGTSFNPSDLKFGMNTAFGDGKFVLAVHPLDNVATMPEAAINNNADGPIVEFLFNLDNDKDGDSYADVREKLVNKKVRNGELKAELGDNNADRYVHVASIYPDPSNAASFETDLDGDKIPNRLIVTNPATNQKTAIDVELQLNLDPLIPDFQEQLANPSTGCVPTGSGNALGLFGDRDHDCIPNVLETDKKIFRAADRDLDGFPDSQEDTNGNGAFDGCGTDQSDLGRASSKPGDCNGNGIDDSLDPFLGGFLNALTGALFCAKATAAGCPHSFQLNVTATQRVYADAEPNGAATTFEIGTNDGTSDHPIADEDVADTAVQTLQALLANQACIKAAGRDCPHFLQLNLTTSITPNGPSGVKYVYANLTVNGAASTFAIGQYDPALGRDREVVGTQSFGDTLAMLQGLAAGQVCMGSPTDARCRHLVQVNLTAAGPNGVASTRYLYADADGSARTLSIGRFNTATNKEEELFGTASLGNLLGMAQGLVSGQVCMGSATDPRCRHFLQVNLTSETQGVKYVYLNLTQSGAASTFAVGTGNAAGKDTERASSGTPGQVLALAQMLASNTACMGSANDPRCKHFLQVNLTSETQGIKYVYLNLTQNGAASTFAIGTGNAAGQDRQLAGSNTLGDSLAMIQATLAGQACMGGPNDARCRHAFQVNLTSPATPNGVNGVKYVYANVTGSGASTGFAIGTGNAASKDTEIFNSKQIGDTLTIAQGLAAGFACAKAANSRCAHTLQANFTPIAANGVAGIKYLFADQSGSTFTIGRGNQDNTETVIGDQNTPATVIATIQALVAGSVCMKPAVGCEHTLQVNLPGQPLGIQHLYLDTTGSGAATRFSVGRHDANGNQEIVGSTTIDGAILAILAADRGASATSIGHRRRRLRQRV